MKKPLPWMIVGAVILFGVAIFQSLSRKPPGTQSAPAVRAELPAAPPTDSLVVLAPPPVAPPVPIARPAMSRIAPTTVDVTTIQDHATIDLSSGRPVVTRDQTDREIIDRTMREIAEATKGVTFDAQTNASAPAKK